MTNLVPWQRALRPSSRRLVVRGLLGGSMALNASFVGSMTLDAWNGTGGFTMAAQCRRGGGRTRTAWARAAAG